MASSKKADIGASATLSDEDINSLREGSAAAKAAAYCMSLI